VIPAWRPPDTGVVPQRPLVERIARHFVASSRSWSLCAVRSSPSETCVLDRGDRKGAFRYAAVVVGVGVLARFWKTQPLPKAGSI
jgi:hypothetical protein